MNSNTFTFFTPRRETVVVLLATLFLFLNTTFYFFDPIYIPRFVTFFLSAIILLILLTQTSLRFRSIFVLILLFSILGQIVAFLNAIVDARLYSIPELLYPYGMLQIVFLLALLSLHKAVALRIANHYINTVAILTVPGLLIHLLLLFNTNLDYQLITLGERDLLTRNYYYVAIFNDYEFLRFGYLTLARMCGMFEEAGMLGTIIAILLAADIVAFPAKKARHILLIMIGIMTLSLTFYVLLGFYILYYVCRHYLKPTALVTSLTAITGLSVLLAVAVPADMRDAFDSLIVSRLVISDGGLAGDSGRISYAERFSEYQSRASVPKLVFGNGAKSNRKDSGADYGDYRSIVYENGYLGLLLMIMFASYFTIYLPLVNGQFALALISSSTLLSFYHRADPLLPHFLIIYSVVFCLAQTPSRGSGNGRLRRRLVGSYEGKASG